METVATLILVGAVLMLLETVLPGVIVGLVGFGCLVAGVVVAYMTQDIETAHWTLLGVLAGLTAGTALWFRFFPVSPMARLFISKGTVGEIGAERPDLVHRVGRTLTPLRPCGTALIGQERVDVVSEGAFVDRDTPVEVIEVEGMRVIVRPCAAARAVEPGVAAADQRAARG